MSTSVQHYSHVFSKEVIESLLTDSEVIQAKSKVDALERGSIYFTIPLSDSIREILENTMGLNLSRVSSIPMRWIKGDLQPHIDTGASKFDRTHLIYLTSSEGFLRIDDSNYAITEGSAYVFSEGSNHMTIGTGSEPRLLMGPMSEQCEAVGLFYLSGAGGTTIYLRQNGSDVEYSSDDMAWYTMYWPCGIQNTDNTNGYLEVKFTNDLTLSASAWQYFIALSTHIQFGSRLLKGDGTRPIITVDGISGYNGLIQNGTEYGNGNNAISVCNLVVRSINGSTLYTDPSGKGSGWVCQHYFGKNGSNNYVINCSSDGPIAEYAGGIIGSHAGSESDGILRVSGCSSSGNIGNYAGGILGASVGTNSGEVICRECWTTGEIGASAGGIVGQNAAESSGSVSITRCYATGIIGGDGGGITGYSPGVSNGTITISACYSLGVIQSNAGGITGSSASNTTITNCYSIGAIQSNAGGIVGIYPDTNTTNITHCYTSGITSGTTGFIIGNSINIPSNCYSEAYQYSSGWNSVNASTVLTGLPNEIVGDVWVNTVSGQPYELRMGYSPYSTEIITSEYVLRSSYEQSIQSGSSTEGAIVSDKSYQILQITNGISSSYETFTIDSSTGVITTSSFTEPGIYTIYVRNDGSYHITEMILTIISGLSCCERPIQWASLADDRMRVDVHAGNILIGTFNTRRGPISYADLIRIKMAYAAKI